MMKQVWHDLLFMHWPVAIEQLRPLIPAELEIESCEGSGWVGVVPFHMSGIRAHWLPPIPGTSAFPELNVRTYVRVGGKSGVWFFSLDAANSLAVAAARRFYHLPYFRARMDARSGPNGEIQYESHRIHSGAASADFRGCYRALDDTVFQARRGSLEYFLVERYCLYAASESRIFWGEIDHAPWPLQRAEAEIEVNTMAAASGITLPASKPLLHFAKRQEVRVWALEAKAPA
ncbi:MAG TPA: DUF2071 domain-containing protein [Candidatus Acidoferrales bacterium]|nr:DUF2071 domain-containing protein [Candidatus Acidoferrales bacterium]